MNADILGLQYERLLTDAVVESGMEMFDAGDEPDGGGRCGKGAKECVVYALFSVSNK